MPPLPRLARNLGLGLASLAPWLPGYVLFLDNVASIEKVSGLSMSPTFCPDPTKKDWILASHWRCTEDLRRGQVVLYRSVPRSCPRSPGASNNRPQITHRPRSARNQAYRRARG